MSAAVKCLQVFVLWSFVM